MHDVYHAPPLFLDPVRHIERAFSPDGDEVFDADLLQGVHENGKFFLCVFRGIAGRAEDRTPGRMQPGDQVDGKRHDDVSVACKESGEASDNADNVLALIYCLDGCGAYDAVNSRRWSAADDYADRFFFHVESFALFAVHFKCFFAVYA